MAWSTFTTSIAIYNAVFQSGAPCGSNSSITVAGNFAINSNTPCVGPAVLISGTSVYAKVSQCDNDNDPHGTAPAWYTDASCTTSPIPGVTSEYGGYGFCARAIGNAFGTTNGVSYIVSCKASPGSSAQGWVAALASFIVIGFVGLLGFWAWRDQLARAKDKRDAAQLLASVAEEEAKAKRIASGKSTTLMGKPPGIAHGGYNAM